MEKGQLISSSHNDGSVNSFPFFFDNDDDVAVAVGGSSKVAAVVLLSSSRRLSFFLSLFIYLLVWFGGLPQTLKPPSLSYFFQVFVGEKRNMIP